MEQQNSVIDFLLQNPIDNVTKEIKVSERLKDYPFTIKAMTSEEHQGYQARAKLKVKKGVDFDSQKFNQLVALNQTMTPFFKDASFVEKAGCKTPEQALGKFLLAGELVELVQQILQFSGFDLEEDELVDEVKNS